MTTFSDRWNLSENKIMLFLLNPTNKYHRILRRGLVIGVLTFVAVIFKEYMTMAPEVLIPILTAVGAAIDKASREFSEKN